MSETENTPKQINIEKSNLEFAVFLENSKKTTDNLLQNSENRIDLNFLCKNNSNIAKTIEDLEKNLYRSKNNDTLLEDANSQIENLSQILNAYKNSKNALSIHYSRQAEKIRLYAKKLSDKVIKYSEDFIKDFYKSYKENLKDLERMISEVSDLKNKTEFTIGNIGKSLMTINIEELNKISTLINDLAGQNINLKKFEDPKNIDQTNILLQEDCFKHISTEKVVFEIDTLQKQFFSSNEYYNLDIVKPKSNMISIRNSLDLDQFPTNNLLRTSLYSSQKFSRESSVQNDIKNIPALPKQFKNDNKILVQSDVVDSPRQASKYLQNPSRNEVMSPIKNNKTDIKSPQKSPKKKDKEMNVPKKDRRIFSKDFDNSNSKSTPFKTVINKPINFDDNTITDTNIKSIFPINKSNKQSNHQCKTSKHPKRSQDVFSSYDPATYLEKTTEKEYTNLAHSKVEETLGKKINSQSEKEQIMKNLGYGYKKEPLNCSKEPIRKSLNNNKKVNSTSRVKNYNTVKSRDNKVQTSRPVASSSKKSTVTSNLLGNTNQKSNIFANNHETTIKKKSAEIYATTNHSSKGYKSIQKTNNNFINSQTILDKVYNEEKMNTTKEALTNKQRVQVTNNNVPNTERKCFQAENKNDSYTFPSNSSHRPYFVKNINEFCKKFSTNNSTKRNVRKNVAVKTGSQRGIRVIEEENILMQSAHNFIQNPDNYRVFTTSPELNYDNEDQFGLASSIKDGEIKDKSARESIRNHINVEINHYSRNAISEACSPDNQKTTQLGKNEFSKLKLENVSMSKKNNVSLNKNYTQRNSFKEVNSPNQAKSISPDVPNLNKLNLPLDDNKMDELFNTIKENTPSYTENTPVTKNK